MARWRLWSNISDFIELADFMRTKWIKIRIFLKKTKEVLHSETISKFQPLWSKAKFSVKCQEGSRVARKLVYFYSFFEGARFFPECNLLSCIFYDLFIGSGLLQNWGCVSISKVVFGIWSSSLQILVICAAK